MEIFNIDLFSEILLHISDMNTIKSITIAIPQLNKYIEKEYIYLTLKNNLIRNNKKHIIKDKYLMDKVYLSSSFTLSNIRYNLSNLKLFYEKKFMTKNSYKYCSPQGQFLIAYTINDINTIDKLINRYDEKSIKYCVSILTNILLQDPSSFYSSYLFFLDKLENITIPLLDEIIFHKDRFSEEYFLKIIYDTISLNQNIYFDEDYSAEIIIHFHSCKNSFDLVYSLLISKVHSRKMLDRYIANKIIKILTNDRELTFFDETPFILKTLEYKWEDLSLILWRISLTNIDQCIESLTSNKILDKYFDIMIYCFSKFCYDLDYKNDLVSNFTKITNDKFYPEYVKIWAKEKLEFILKEYNKILIK